MGKSYKKHLKEERAKVKLKNSQNAKTILPKGQNLTDTNFKVKKIVIKDQIKAHDLGELLFRNKLNVKELIGRLRHHNCSIKIDALDGLKQLITQLPEDKLELEFSNIVNAVIKLILYQTNEVRKTANKLLSSLFSKLGINDKKLLYHIINSYLICGLTHIDLEIRNDSLHFLDTCLKFGPRLCSEYAFHLVFICLDLISDQSEDSRTLLLNLNYRSGSKAWRTKVLLRIYNLLETLIKYHKDFNKTNEEFTAKVHRSIEFEGKKNWFVAFTPINKNYSLSENTINNEEISILELCDAIFPVIFQIFFEICPPDMSKFQSHTTTNVSSDDMACLSVATQIIEMLHTMCEKNDSSNTKTNYLKNKYGSNFVKNMIDNKFPFSAKATQGRKITEDDDESDMFSQNLTLAKLVFSFGKKNDWDLVIPYLKNLFRENDKLTPNDLVTLFTCVEKICKLKNCEHLEFFLSKTVSLSNEKNRFSPHCFKLLSHLALDKNANYVHENKGFQSWLGTLPQKLTKRSITAYQADITCQIALRNFPTFIDSLSGLIEAILDNITKMEIVGKTDVNIQERIASLIYLVDDLDEELLNELKTPIENYYWGDSLTKYIKDIIWLKQRDTMKL